MRAYGWSTECCFGIGVVSVAGILIPAGNGAGETCLHVYQDRRIWLVNAARVTYAAVAAEGDYILEENGYTGL